MKKFLTVLIFLSLILITAVNAAEKKKKYKDLPPGFRVNVGGLTRYEPFVWIEEEKTFASIRLFADGFFPELVRELFDEAGIHSDMVIYKSFGSLEKLDKAAKDGLLDFVMGLYFTEDLYLNYEIIYPPIYINPITAFFKLDKINTLTKWSDLDNLKGVARSDEFFSSTYNDKIRNDSNITMVKNSFDAFNEILTGKADYFITSAYAGQAEAFRMGIIDLVSFVRRPKWKDNIFIGTVNNSKTARRFKKDVIAALEKFRKKNTGDKIMINAVAKWQRKYPDAKFTKFVDYNPEIIDGPSDEELLDKYIQEKYLSKDGSYNILTEEGAKQIKQGKTIDEINRSAAERSSKASSTAEDDGNADNSSLEDDTIKNDNNEDTNEEQAGSKNTVRSGGLSGRSTKTSTSGGLSGHKKQTTEPSNDEQNTDDAEEEETPAETDGAAEPVASYPYK
ncbi:MAG: substrate-binding periplasmic protein [Alphaproteobacteria bacterium]